LAFDSIVEGGAAVLSQDFGQTAYAMACRCEWTCPGYAPGSFHAGIDLASVGGGEPYLLAVGYGQCVKVGRVLAGYSCSGLGPYAPCINSGGVDIWYGHAKQSLVNPGDYVVPGQRIAIMDSIGCSTGNHVHFEVVPAGSDPNGCAALNPWAYVNVWPGQAPNPISSGPPPALYVPPALGRLAPLGLAAVGAGLLLLGRSKTSS